MSRNSESMHRIPETVELAQTLKEVPKKRQFNSERSRLSEEEHKAPVMTVVLGGQIQAADARIWGVMDALPVLPQIHECPTILGTIRRIPLRYGEFKVRKDEQPMEVKTR